jgi:hypothetical protein
MSACEDETISTTMECRLTRKPRRPNADGSCPENYEKIEGFLLPTCLPIVPSSYQCYPNDPRLCFRPRTMITLTTYPPLDIAYPNSL